MSEYTTLACTPRPDGSTVAVLPSDKCWDVSKPTIISFEVSVTSPEKEDKVCDCDECPCVACEQNMGESKCFCCETFKLQNSLLKAGAARAVLERTLATLKKEDEVCGCDGGDPNCKIECPCGACEQGMDESECYCCKTFKLKYAK